MTQSRVHSPRRVVAVRYGEWATTRSEVFHDGVEAGAPAAPFVLAYYFWIVETPDRTVVVDTGFDPAVADRRGRTALVAFADAHMMVARLQCGAVIISPTVCSRSHPMLLRTMD